ncbi:hypothetical protein [Microseira sp. BLCC-F43]|uniref:hypothetical protein n=1 Tax=Microseira sp. BLCC-F43 TaxID=3153602 RepID=UPI0035BB45D3
MKRIIAGFMLAVALFFSCDQIAVAKALTPEAESYQVEPNYAGKRMVETIKDKIEAATENVVEKLNLNEPLPESTKEFLSDVESKVDETVEPITGNQGYYKEK